MKKKKIKNFSETNIFIIIIFLNGENGKPYSPEFVSHKFRKILDLYNLKKIRLHDLRHSCASLLIANDFQLKDIQEWLGHADIQTTANIYAHLDVRRKENIATAMSNSFKVNWKMLEKVLEKDIF